MEPAQYERARTTCGVTETSRGLVPHLRVVIKGVVMWAPVVLVAKVNNGAFLDPKVNVDGRYIHALPGGIHIVGHMA